MEIHGWHRFRIARHALWMALDHPEAIVAGMSDVRQFERVADEQYLARVRVGVGLLRGTVIGHAWIVERISPYLIRLEVKGRGGPAKARGQATIRLDETGGATIFRYEGTIQIESTLPFFRSRALQPVIERIISEALLGFERHLVDSSQTKLGLQPPTFAKLAMRLVRRRDHSPPYQGGEPAGPSHPASESKAARLVRRKQEQLALRKQDLRERRLLEHRRRQPDTLANAERDAQEERRYFAKRKQ